MDCYSLKEEEADPLEFEGFDKERELQDLVDVRRNILPIDVSDKNVAVREFMAIDNLILGSDAGIYVLEDKLARNTTKRKVLSQALDYSTELQKVPADEFLEEIEERAGYNFVSDWFEDSGDEDYFREKLQYNLRNGFLTVVVVMDEISEKLREKVRFVNRSSAYDILLVEVRRLERDGEDLVFVSSYGGEVEESYTHPRKEAISFDEFVKKCAENDEREEAVSYVSALKTLAPKMGVEIERKPGSIGIKDNLLRWTKSGSPLAVWIHPEDYEDVRDRLEDAPENWADRIEIKEKIDEDKPFGKAADIEMKGADESDIRKLVRFFAENLDFEPA